MYEAEAMQSRDDTASYSVGAVTRLTGLSAHVLRAWERRYGAVSPRRTPGGSRRYTEAEVRRLQLLQAGVSAGHPISELAALPDEEIERRLAALRSAPPARPLPQLLEAIQRLDAAALERLLGTQFAALGPAPFAREIVAPLFQEIGERWSEGRLSIAAEHMASAAVRGLLGVALRTNAVVARRRPLVFTTPAGERHELGTMVAALVALGAGANVVYLGPDLPAEEAVAAAQRLGAAALVLGFTHALEADARRYVKALRSALSGEIAVWLGGARAPALSGAGIEPVRDLDALEQRVARLVRSQAWAADPRLGSSPRR